MIKEYIKIIYEYPTSTAKYILSDFNRTIYNGCSKITGTVIYSNDPENHCKVGEFITCLLHSKEIEMSFEEVIADIL